MKTYQLKPSTIVQSAILTRLPSLLRGLAPLEDPRPDAPPRPWVCIGADLEKSGACIAVQIGAQGVCAGGDFTRSEILALTRELLARGWRVALGVEAWLSKPFDGRTLIACVKRALATRDGA